MQHTPWEKGSLKVRRRRSEEDSGSAEGEEESDNVEGILHNLTIETGGTDEEATEGLEAALRMEVDGDDKDEGVGEGGEEGAGNLRALGDLE